jgi:Flp pilus assembly protein TadB
MVTHRTLLDAVLVLSDFLCRDDDAIHDQHGKNTDLVMVIAMFMGVILMMMIIMAVVMLLWIMMMMVLVTTTSYMINTAKTSI